MALDDLDHQMRPVDAIAVGMVAAEIRGDPESIVGLFKSWSGDPFELAESIAGYAGAFAIAAALHQGKDPQEYVRGLALVIAEHQGLG